MQASAVLINGSKDSHISTLDRGLMYGDGLFETIAVRGGEIKYWNEHIERLQRGCKILGFDSLNVALLKKEVVLAIGEDSDCVIKIIITRGAGARSYKPTKQELTRIIHKYSWPTHDSTCIQEGVDITLCNFRLARQVRLSRIKHLNRLEQVLARSEWDDEFHEGLVCDTNDLLIEATSSNVFIELNDALYTPDLTQCGVEGVMRNKIIEYCKQQGIMVSVQEIDLKFLSRAEAIFLCNCIIGVWPVKSFDGRSFKKTAIIQKIMSEFNQ